jgi:hypothetical protein
MIYTFSTPRITGYTPQLILRYYTDLLTAHKKQITHSSKLSATTVNCIITHIAYVQMMIGYGRLKAAELALISWCLTF